MGQRWVILFMCSAWLAFAQGTTPKKSAAEYPVRAVAGNVELGAEFMVHSFSQGEESYIAKDFLVVEVAVFALNGRKVDTDVTKFGLRINGKKQALPPQPPAVVAASLTHPEWNERPRFEAGGGMGGVGVGVGGQRRSQIPGMPDPNAPPRPPDVPRDNSGVTPREHVKPEQLVVETALPQGERSGPVSGFLYFAYKGKPSSIKSLELLYDGAVLKLR